MEALEGAQEEEPEALETEREQGSARASGRSGALLNVVVDRGQVEHNGVEDAKGQDDQTRDEEDGGEQTERVVGDTFESSVAAELGTLQEDVRHVVKDEHNASNAMLSKLVGDGQQCDGHDVVSDHDQLILVVGAGVAEEEDDERSRDVESGLHSVDDLQANTK